MNVNRKKKIAILGVGNAACATALTLYERASHLIDIVIYYDSTIPIEKVGQGSTTIYPSLISRVFGINWYKEQNHINATLKTGILYENWGTKNSKIFHAFPFDSIAMHFVPHLMSNLILQSGLFEVVDKNVIDPEEEIDADFIFDCRGKDNRDPNLYDKLINPLNHVILGKKSKSDLSLTYTRCVATPDGWTFVIPNIDSVSYGYLFNSNITTIKQAKNNFIQIFGDDLEIDSDFRFENYIAKSCFCGKRTILNGNKLSFLEPLEATSIAFYIYAADNYLNYMFGDGDKDICNENIRKEMYRIQDFVLWHYQYGSKYDTLFWKYAKSLPFNPDLELKNILREVKKTSSLNVRLNFDKEEKYHYSQWVSSSVKLWVEMNE